MISKRMLERGSLFRIIPMIIAIGFYVNTSSGAPQKYNDFSIQFVARPPSSSSSPTGKSVAGHAYIIINTRLLSGIKQEVFGFYPKADTGLGIIRGPGMLTNESRCRPTEACGQKDFALKLGGESGVIVSSSIEITPEQKRDVMKVISSWSKHEFSLIDSNCITFLSEVLHATGYESPRQANKNILPVYYVSAIDEAVKSQDKIRILEREHNEALALKRKAEEAKARKIAADAAAAAEAKRIPPGWVACTCPNIHGSSGKFVNGTLWHPQGIRCP